MMWLANALRSWWCSLIVVVFDTSIPIRWRVVLFRVFTGFLKHSSVIHYNGHLWATRLFVIVELSSAFLLLSPIYPRVAFDRPYVLSLIRFIPFSSLVMICFYRQRYLFGPHFEGQQQQNENATTRINSRPFLSVFSCMS